MVQKRKTDETLWNKYLSWKEGKSLEDFRQFLSQGHKKVQLLYHRVGFNIGDTFATNHDYRIRDDLRKVESEINEKGILPYPSPHLEEFTRCCIEGFPVAKEIKRLSEENKRLQEENYFLKNSQKKRT